MAEPLAGVSCVICCHNGAKRLPETLGFLKRQKVRAGINWEVLLIDNGSTDDTAKVANEIWAQDAAPDLPPLRIVSEPTLGLSFARYRGLECAKYDCVSLIDDDNWVCDQWINLVYDAMVPRKNVGLLVSVNEAYFGTAEPPAWFDRFEHCYAVGTTAVSDNGDVTDEVAFVFGAGMTIRKSAWDQLFNAGFRLLNTDRQGSNLTSGGDTEIAIALKMSGWRIWKDSGLQLQHFIPPERLNWHYLRRLNRGFGGSSVAMDAYIKQRKPRTGLLSVTQTWHYQLCRTAFDVVLQAHPIAVWKNQPGDNRVLDFEIGIGRLEALWKSRAFYAENQQKISAASWRKISWI